MGVAMIMTSAGSHAVLSINEPWVRVAADGTSAELFMMLRSSESATLVGVDSFAARTVAIRTPRGAPLRGGLALPANVLVELKPADTRIVLNRLVRRLKLGVHVPITLVVQSADGLQQTLYINAEVRRHSPTEDEMNPHAHH
jgi:copper(I)-binding protein